MAPSRIPQRHLALQFPGQASEADDATAAILAEVGVDHVIEVAAQHRAGQYSPPEPCTPATETGHVHSRPWILAETSLQAVRSTEYEVAVLPWGATEAHNYHLPYATDTVQTERVAAEAARIAWDAGAKVVVLPAMPFGVQTGQLDIPLCLNVNPTTQAALLADIIESLAPHGIRKLVILNGHGGNDFKAMIRELQPDSELFLCALNWYACMDARKYFDEPGDHAGELETSVMLHLAPDLVQPLEVAGPGTAKQFRIEGLRDGWAWASRQWTEISEDTGVGNPRASTAEKGSAFYAAVTQRIGGFLAELAAADLEDLYA